MSDMENVVGNLRKIRFRGDNGFIIGMFWDGNTEFAGLGNVMNPEEGISYKLWGRWTEHKTFGKQFNFDFYDDVDISCMALFNLQHIGSVENIKAPIDEEQS
jgi:hypothetical protein